MFAIGFVDPNTLSNEKLQEALVLCTLAEEFCNQRGDFSTAWKYAIEIDKINAVIEKRKKESEGGRS